MVEQNAKKGLEFAELGYVLVSGQVPLAGSCDELLENPEVGHLFLSGQVFSVFGLEPKSNTLYISEFTASWE